MVTGIRTEREFVSGKREYINVLDAGVWRLNLFRKETTDAKYTQNQIFTIVAAGGDEFLFLHAKKGLYLASGSSVFFHYTSICSLLTNHLCCTRETRTCLWVLDQSVE